LDALFGLLSPYRGRIVAKAEIGALWILNHGVDQREQTGVVDYSRMDAAFVLRSPVKT
jgi:hypothetical protein